MKRFYKATSVAAVEGGWQAQIDGRAIKTPAKAALVVPTQGLAQVIAGEWAAQGEKVIPESMPMTQYVCSAIDRVAPARAEIIGAMSAFAETDLICYPAGTPLELRTMQDAAWLPLIELLGWPLKQTDTLTAIDQDPSVRPRAATWLQTLEPFALTAVASLIEASGSFFLAYGLATKAWDLQTLLDASSVEERYALKKWGSDEEAEQLMARRAADLTTLSQMLDLLS